MSLIPTIKFIVAMITMMNPLASLSIFLELTKKSAVIDQKAIAQRACFAIAVIMVISLWIGNGFLDLLGITIPAFRCAGGLILLLTGLSMLQSKESPLNHTEADDEAAKERHSIAVVPLALPVIVGPGAISTLIIATSDHPDFFHKFWLSIICLLLAILMGTMLYFANPIAKLVGASVIKVITRIMGMIIMAIAVGMLTDGLMGLFPSLGAQTPALF